MKLYKEAYEQLISEDIKALNEQMACCPESSHIEQVLKDSVRFYYPEHISTVQDCELAVNETKKKAIEAYKKACTCIGCHHCDDCDSVREFTDLLNS